MRLTTLLMLALIALAPTSAVAATQPKLPPGCVSIPDMEKTIEGLKASLPEGVLVVRTRQADEVRKMALEANKVDGQTIDVPKIVEVILLRTAKNSLLMFAQKDRSCNMLKGPTDAVMGLIQNALGDPS